MPPASCRQLTHASADLYCFTHYKLPAFVFFALRLNSATQMAGACKQQALLPGWHIQRVRRCHCHQVYPSRAKHLSLHAHGIYVHCLCALQGLWLCLERLDPLARGRHDHKCSPLHCMLQGGPADSISRRERLVASTPPSSQQVEAITVL